MGTGWTEAKRTGRKNGIRIKTKTAKQEYKKVPSDHAIHDLTELLFYQAVSYFPEACSSFFRFFWAVESISLIRFS